MNKVLATLIIGAFSAAAFAADPPKADAKDAKGAKPAAAAVAAAPAAAAPAAAPAAPAAKAEAKAEAKKVEKLSKQTLPKTAKSKPTAEGTMPELSSSGIFLRLHAKSVAALKWASTHY